MTKIFFITFVCMGAAQVSAQTIQTYNIDSLKQVLSTTGEDTNRVWALDNLGRNIQNSDTTIILAEQAIALSRRLDFVKGEAEAYNNIGYWFTQKGNYPKALESYLKAIQLSESINFEAGLKRSFNNASAVYRSLKDYTTAIRFARRGRMLSIKLNDFNTQALSSSSLSLSFQDLHQPDSALSYALESYEAANKLKDPLPLYQATARLSEVNMNTGNYPLALEYSRLSLEYSKKDGRSFRIAGSHYELAMVFKSMGDRDSCLWHAQQAFSISQKENLAATQLSASLLLSELFEGTNNSESLRYHKLALVAQDSLFSQEKNRQIDILNVNETLRQREIEAEKQREAEERKNNLQYAAIALGLITFVILFLLFSHSALANQTLIRYLGILALLIVFEFINLLLHPFLGELTHHSPFLMLACMVVLAALLIPLHHHLEKWIIHTLIERNDKIRRAAVKKTGGA